jgi:hypothetical protein
LSTQKASRGEASTSVSLEAVDHGVLALLELFPELQRARVMDDDQAAAIMISVIDALDDIHPNARLANMKSNATATE